MTGPGRDHGGNLDWAKARYGGDDWIDLSTGINRVPYPVPDLPAEAFTALPARAAMDRLLEVARRAYGSEAPIVALAGAQAAIQMVPMLRAPGLARVLAPTYNEHAATLRASGWRVEEVPTLAGLAGADLAVVVNPNNPDGRHHGGEALLALRDRVGMLVVDESFADPEPGASLAGEAGTAGLIVLRSFGKFYGLAGLRLGFALGPAAEMARMRDLAGPWPVSGPAIAVGTVAFQDAAWAAATRARLAAEAVALDEICRKIGWQPLGGTSLFRLYDTPDAGLAQEALAEARIWSRIFPYSRRWIRLGLPGGALEWQRVAALQDGQIAHPT
ncbi:threonine-phosphate decarboxylase [bacterium]|nr:threonine-phosphate decarboxylase [bacterium]